MYKIVYTMPNQIAHAANQIISAARTHVQDRLHDAKDFVRQREVEIGTRALDGSFQDVSAISNQGSPVMEHLFEAQVRRSLFERDPNVQKWRNTK